MKYTTEKGLREIRAIAERAYVRGSDACKVSPIALLAILDEIKDSQQSVQAYKCSRCHGRGWYTDGHDNTLKCPACNGTGIRQ